jgi:hypothetical protein
VVEAAVVPDGDRTVVVDLVSSDSVVRADSLLREREELLGDRPDENRRGVERLALASETRRDCSGASGFWFAVMRCSLVEGCADDTPSSLSPRWSWTIATSHTRDLRWLV